MDRLAWITGAGGLIGSCIARATPPEWTARALRRADLELTDFPALRTLFAREQPQLVIHCAAFSKTLACEKTPDLAQLHNVEVTRALSELASDIPLLFFSTDLVFDGRKGNYSESDLPNPLTVYAETKAAAEQIVLANPKHTVIRTSLNAGRTARGNAFNELWLAAWRRGETLNLFTDEFRSPIAAEVTARAVWELVRATRPGLYHLTGSERLSRYEIGQLLAAAVPGVSARVERGSIQNYTALRRSPDTSLDSSRIQALLSFPLPRFSDWVRGHPESVAP